MMKYLWLGLLALACFCTPAYSTTVNVPGFEQQTFTNANGAWVAASIVAAPVGNEEVGTVYLISNAGTGTFATYSKHIAILTAEGWFFVAPSEGVTAFIQGLNTVYQYNGTKWVIATGTSGLFGTANITDDLIATDLTGSDYASFCGYYSCADHGGGLFHRETCTPDNGMCIADSAGNTFKRQAPQGLADEYGVTLGSVYDAATHPTNPLGAANRIAAAVAGFKAAGLSELKLGVNIYFGQDFTLAPDFTINCGFPQGGEPTNNDFRYVTAHGIIAHPSTTDLKFDSSDRAVLKGCLILRSDGSFAPTVNFPTNMRDSLTAVSQFAGTGIAIDDTDTPRLENVMVLGFNKAVLMKNVTGSLQRPDFDHVSVDGNTGMSLQDIGSDGQVEDVRVQSYITENPHSNASDYDPIIEGQIDNLLTDGSAHYKVVTELPTTDPGGPDAGQYLAIQTGDPIEVQTTSHGTRQAQSANNGWVAGTVTIIHSPTDGCAAPNCQEVVLTGSHFGAVVTAATFEYNSNVINIASAADAANMAAGQTFTAGTCIPAGTEIADVHVWADGTASIWMRAASDHSTRVYTTCATPQNVTATDVAFSSINADDEIIINSKVRSGPGLEFVNVAGVRVFGAHSYEHKTGMHIGANVGNLTLQGVSLGLGDPSPDQSFVSVLIDGTDTDPAGRRCHITGIVASQHYAHVLRVDGPGQEEKPCVLENIGLGSGVGDNFGSSINLLRGGVVIIGSNGGHDNIFAGAGTELTLSDYHGHDSPSGGGTQLYVQDDTAIIAGCGNTGFVYATMGARNYIPGECIGKYAPEADNAEITLKATSQTLQPANCGSRLRGNGVADNYVKFPANPPAGCRLAVVPTLNAIFVNFNGQVGRLNGTGSHDVTSIKVPFVNTEYNAGVTFVFDGAKWVNGEKSMLTYEAVTPLDDQRLAHGQVIFSYDSGNTRFQLCRLGPGGLIVNLRMDVIPADCLFLVSSATTSSNLNYFYAIQNGHVAVTSSADNGSAATRLAIANSSVAGDRVGLLCHSSGGQYDGAWAGDVIDNAHIDLRGSTFGSSATGACRMTYLGVSTTGHSEDANTGVQIKTGDPTATLVGMAYIGAANAVNDSATKRDVASWYNRKVKTCKNVYTADRTTASTSYAEPNAEIECEFVTWGENDLRWSIAGEGSNGTNADGFAISAGFDGTTAETEETGGHNLAGSSGYKFPFGVSGSKGGLSEAKHYITLIAKSLTGGTTTIAGAASPVANVSVAIPQ